MSEFASWDATDQAELVRSGQVAAVELVEAAIKTIEDRDGEVNAVVYKRYDLALEEAKSGRIDGPFSGVPTLTKSLSELAGAPVDLASQYLAKHGVTAKADSRIVSQLQRAGFIVLGQTASPEFGLVSTTESAVYGVTRNPWNLDHTSGGSSGGASAAVSAGMVAVAHGGDGGGSVRMPAAFCQLVGLKPSLGLVPEVTGVGDRWGHSVGSLVSRTVRDTAAVIEMLADRSNRSLRLPVFDHGDLRDAPNADVGSLRIGVVATAPDHAPPVDGTIQSAVWSIASLMESIGHRVEEAHPEAMFDPLMMPMFFDSLSVTVSRGIDALIEQTGAVPEPDGLDPITRHWEARGRSMTAIDLVNALAWQEDFRVRMATWWDEYDLLLSPVFGTPAPEVSWPWTEDGGIQKSVDVLTFTAPFNTSGQPAISVPAGLSEAGLPIGVQFAAAYGREDLLLAAARQVEVARPWESIAPRYR